jgi:hypothetical protein
MKPMLAVLGAWIAVSVIPADAPAQSKRLVATNMAPAATGKERLGDKASDNQRVDDCRVPPEKRGPVKRPTECAQK